MSGQGKFRHTVKKVALMSTISSYFIGSVVGGVLLGYWLDARFDTDPWLLLIGFFVGLSGAIFGITQVIRHFLGDNSS
ncbi:AtpZ/AtpI family protein [Texcoconibacillus texcoconensis]|uniref:F0F1-type ATP synthase assembly protein I n=1 Tax=Texcoconibacillus texcoconensis TaxID=1095777 RepID=A0A840QRX8_9BACI|nr:AtpZ/AtpI family protein [Texcoconibacillus texcoconensis]MBB5174078.1 F0F1-type ATP synthase assembly protein I [Texcoconibacillus texcoconensis]